MPRLALLVAAVSLGACAEIEFGVPAGGGAAGGAGGGAGGPLAGGAGGAAPTGEQCLNGVDDDDDALADCADDDCTQVGCLDLPPEWIGPVELRSDDSPCEGDFSIGIASLKTSVDAPAARCSCSCTGGIQSCATAGFETFANQTCGNQIDKETLASGQCEVLTDLGAVDGYQVDPQGPAACTPAVDENLPTPSFDAQRLCGLPAPPAGCKEGTCAPSSGSCVYASGNLVCPSGFATSFTGSAGIVDSRACAPGSCNCGAATGGCGFTFELFDSPVCGGAPISSTMSTLCEAESFGNGPGSYSAVFTGVDGQFSCAASGTPTATGSVALSEPITVCCAL